jgi:hypothetical protein
MKNSQEKEKSGPKFTAIDYLDYPCELIYSKVHEPVAYPENNPNKHFEVSMVSDEENVQALSEIIDEVIAVATEEAASQGYKVDESGRSEDLLKVFKGDLEGQEYFKAKKSAKSGDIKFYDENGEAMHGFKELIGNGTKAVVSLVVSPYYMPAKGRVPAIVSASLKISAIQIVELVRYAGTGGASFAKVDDFNGLRVRRHNKAVSKEQDAKDFTPAKPTKANSKGLGAKYNI